MIHIQIDILPVEVIHLKAVSSLPLYHRDPFDRLLIAQAISEQVSIISADKVFDRYPVNAFGKLNSDEEIKSYTIFEKSSYSNKI